MRVRHSFKKLCLRGMTEEARLYARAYYIPFSELDAAFVGACERGHLGTARWMLVEFSGILDHPGVALHEAFQGACAAGHLDVAQWIWGVWGPKSILAPALSIHANDEKAFVDACHGGHLAVAQWLRMVCATHCPCSDGVRHTICDNFAFQGACANGHLETAQWVWSLGGVDHRVHSDIAFDFACYFGHFPTARWLVSLDGDVLSDDESTHLSQAKALYAAYVSRMRWRGILRAACVLLRVYMGFLKRYYAPGGKGFTDAKDDFHYHSSSTIPSTQSYLPL